jgi:hypothetical protein
VSADEKLAFMNVKTLAILFLFSSLAGPKALLADSPSPVDPKAWPRERLLAFAHELADFVYEHHVVTDPAHKTFGMTYEFWKDGKKVQEFGLDSMHDGAWFTSAMVAMHRADPEGHWLERAQKYQVPFYINMLIHSDRLFPAMKPTDEDKKPFERPIKGWAPRGWDDGLGFNKNDGKPIADSYFTASNHLSQDLADMLMNVWLTTDDPQVAEALGALRAYKREYSGPIQGLEVAAAVALGEPGVFDKYKLPVFTPESLNPFYTGLYLKKNHSIPAYDDALAWQYRQATARGEVSPEFAWHAAARVLAIAKAMELYFDTRPWRDGEFFFDIQRQPAFVDGKLQPTASHDRAHILGGRGVQLAWIGAAVLPTIKAHPEIWAKSAPKELAGEDVPTRLERLAIGSIDYWHEVWKQAGVIPSGWHRDNIKAGGWTLSDAGNYAHLLHCIAYVLIEREGKTEWQIIRDQTPARPMECEALPLTVKKAQGL